MTAGPDGADGKETPWLDRISWSLWTNQCTLWSPAIASGRGVVSSSRKVLSHTLGCRHCQGHLSCSSSCFGFLSVSLGHFPFFIHFHFHTLFVLPLWFIHYLCIYLLFLCILMSVSHSVINVFHPFLYQISIAFSSGPRLPAPSLFLSVSRWFWGFAVKCVGGEKKVFSVQKNDNLSFFSLVLSLSRWICSQQCHRVSLEMFFL